MPSSRPPMPSDSPWPAFWQGWWRGMPIALAVAAYGILLGVNAALAGLNPLELTTQSLLVFAGTSQLLSVELWGQPILVILVATLAMNFRYFLIGASLRDLYRGLPLWRKMLAIHPVADENWALTLALRAKTPQVGLAFLLGSGFALMALWLFGGLAGIFAANLLPDPQASIQAIGLDFAVPAIFIALALSFFKAPSDGISWAVCGAVAVALRVLWPDEAWYLLVAPLAGLAAASLVYVWHGGQAES